MSNEYKDWERDLIEDQNRIVEKYPFLRARTFDGEIDYEDRFPMMGLEIPDGWFELFYQMCDDIKPIIEDQGLMANFYFVQVKEKFNNLICYASIDVPEINEIIAKYGIMATNVCTICGAPADVTTLDYYASLCNKCWGDKLSHLEAKKIKPRTSISLLTFNKDGNTKEEISFEDEWKRYLNNYMRGKI